MLDIAEEYVKNVEAIAPCPEVALDVLSMAHDPDCSIPVLSEKIEQDPGLTASMLRMANSAYFGHMKNITSVKDIVARLGMDAVKIIAITSASAGLFRAPQVAYALGRGELWRHSVAVAVLAKIIARHARASDTAAIYTAGLLHDVGKVILDQPLQLESYNRDENDGQTGLLTLERRLLHTDHAEVGMALLVKWGLPEAVFVPVGLHHDLTRPQAKNMDVKIIYLANRLVHLRQYGADDSEDFFFDVPAYEGMKEGLPEVPNFANNLRLIFEEFADKYHDAVAVFTL
ncbi:MAG: HDOD domain-containing protein [Desulfurivibrionaceae bacterium]